MKNRCGIASCKNKPSRFITLNYQRIWVCSEHFTAFSAGQLEVMQVQNQSSVWEPGSEAFDRYQFDHRIKSSTPESRLAYSDLERMKVRRGPAPRQRHWIPTFANDDKLLRLVVAQRIWRYAYLGTGRVPDELANELDALIKVSDEGTKKFLGLQFNSLYMLESQFRHKSAVEHAGNYVSLLMNAAYRAWRLRWNSVDVAESLGLAPNHVRQILARLRWAARSLGLTDDIKVHTSKGMKRTYKHRRAMTIGNPYPIRAHEALISTTVH